MVRGTTTLGEWCTQYFFDNVEDWELNDFEFPNIDIAESIAVYYSSENPDKKFFVFQQENCDWYTVDYYEKEECGYSSFEEYFKEYTNAKLIRKYF